MKDSLLTLAKEHNLFDWQWYQNTYKLLFASEEEAFEHYLRVSPFSRVDPSPNFSSLAYFQNNHDVYIEQISPLAHYLHFGMAEGRKKYKSYVPAINTAATPRSTENLIPKSIAIVLHIFYEEFINLLANAISGFPFNFDLLVTASANIDLISLKKSFSKINKCKHIKAKHVSNRGRNFSGMLIEFREELLSYEYLVHMHSKKSLYSGREQTQWANYQIEYLVRDKIILSRTFDHLLKNPQLGLYYPESFWCLPPWVNHCLSNTHSLNELEQRLKVKLYHGFFSYPVGGMFTARTDALRPLLDYPWTYDHLPQEPISNDGTILHAIERAIPAIAKHAGYNILFYSDRSGQHHTDDSYIFDAYKSLKLESVYSIIDDFDVISFDLFDTLVFRSVTNNDYAKYLLPGSLHIDIDPLKFVSIRNSKEIEIRKSKDFIGDVTIHEVYRAIVKDHFNQLDPDQLADAELEIDMDLIKPKEAIITLMNHCRNLGKYINVVTDTYYSKRQIERILERFDIKVDNLFVSTDIGVRKDNGSMWAHISGIYADKIQTVLHIGDNPVSDCQIPGNYGITSVHLLHPHDRARAEFKLELDGSRFDDEYISRYSDLHSFLSKYPFVEYRSM